MRQQWAPRRDSARKESWADPFGNLERFQSILEISTNTEGLIKSADEVEALLVEEIRRLGSTTMRDWAAGAEKRLGAELEQKEASANWKEIRLTAAQTLGKAETSYAATFGSFDEVGEVWDMAFSGVWSRPGPCRL